MHDIKIIRKNSDTFLKKLSDRNVKIDLKNLLGLDEQNRKLIQKKEKLEQEKKIISRTKDKKQFKKSKEISNEADLNLVFINKISEIKYTFLSFSIESNSFIFFLFLLHQFLIWKHIFYISNHSMQLLLQFFF